MFLRGGVEGKRPVQVARGVEQRHGDEELDEVHQREPLLVRPGARGDQRSVGTGLMGSKFRSFSRKYFSDLIEKRLRIPLDSME